MAIKKDQPIDYNQPVAYDTKGRPLYLRPPVDSTTSARKSTPKIISTDEAEVTAKHHESTIDYSHVMLDNDEYIVLKLPRSSIGVVIPLVGAVLLAVLTLTGLAFYVDFFESIGLIAPPPGQMILIAGLLILLDGLLAYIAIWVYYRNQLYITNKSVIGHIQHTLFSKRVQKVEIDNIEDVSFHQSSVLGVMFNYGQIRLSTVGDENTYKLNYVTSPHLQVELINDITTEHKNSNS